MFAYVPAGTDSCFSLTGSTSNEGKTTGWQNIPAPEGWVDGCDVDRRLLEDDLYDLRNLPAIYLLDADKKIMLKNATVQRLEQVLEQVR